MKRVSLFVSVVKDLDFLSVKIEKNLLFVIYTDINKDLLLH